MNIADTYMTYQLVKRLITPITRWPAFEAGIIDKDGKVVKKYSTLSTEDKKKFTTFDAVVLKIKRVMVTVPGLQIIGNLTIAKALTREEFDEGDIQEELFTEDAPTNSTGSGQVQGMGQGPNGEPGKRTFSKLKKMRNKNDSNSISSIFIRK